MNLKKNSTSSYSYQQWQILFISLLIVFSTLTVYWQVRSFEFINFDDQLYVTNNTYVNNGISIDSIRWAFSLYRPGEFIYWHPLTSLSQMLDCELFGLNAGLHHMTSVFIHIANALLLFTVMRLMTGALWKSAFVAGLFAIHPINVDSIAWISERKNVLSTFFWMGSMLSYFYYAKKPGGFRYLILITCFSLGLLAKPMLVTLPFVLLLLDFWPLNRFYSNSLFTHDLKNPSKIQKDSVLRLIIEKIPLLILSIASIIISILSLQIHDQMGSTDVVPVLLRFENAIISYIKYIFKAFWPTNYSIYYPFPDAIPIWQPVAAGIALIVISIFVIYYAKQKPFYLIGWLWYLGTLVPVIGLIQGGRWPEIADRWAYVPLIGIFIMTAWGGSELLSSWRQRRIRAICITSVIFIILIPITQNQVSHWKNSITLFKHAISVTSKNEVAQYNLGHALYNLSIDLTKKELAAEALKHLNEALILNPDNVRAHNNIGNILAKSGNFEEAKRHFLNVLQIDSNHAEARNNLANALICQGRISAGITQYLKLLEINPQFADAHDNLGLAYASLRQYDKAIQHLRLALKINPENKKTKNNLEKIKQLKAISAKTCDELLERVRLNPEDPQPHYNLGVFYQKQHKLQQAMDQYQTVLSLDPGFTDAMYNMAIIYALKNEYNESITWFNKILQFKPDSPAVCYNIACIYARQNKQNKAVLWLKRAVGMGYNNLKMIESDKDLENIRGTAYYQELLRNGEKKMNVERPTSNDECKNPAFRITS